MGRSAFFILKGNCRKRTYGMTIKDIARFAGVSIATVSRVLNNQCVARLTRSKILKIIARYQYYPNSFARYLGHKNNVRFIHKKCNRLH